MKKIFAFAAASLMLSGCVIAPPYHDHGRDRDYDGGYHCSPGQGKKKQLLNPRPTSAGLLFVQ